MPSVSSKHSDPSSCLDDAFRWAVRALERAVASRSIVADFNHEFTASTCFSGILSAEISTSMVSDAFKNVLGHNLVFHFLYAVEVDRKCQDCGLATLLAACGCSSTWFRCFMLMHFLVHPSVLHLLVEHPLVCKRLSGGDITCTSMLRPCVWRRAPFLATCVAESMPSQDAAPAFDRVEEFNIELQAPDQDLVREARPVL